MKVTTVEIHPAGSSDICILSYRDPKRLNPYNVKAILGLDAEEIVPRYYGVSETSGSKFFNMILEKRDIVVRVEMNPNYTENETYSDLRDRLYKMIASSRTGVVWLHFLDGENSVAAISGTVSKLEATHFEKTPEVQITFKCEDPMLRALNATEVDVEGLDPALTVIENSLSTAPHGMVFDIEFADFTPSFVIGDPDGEWSFEIVPLVDIIPGFYVGDVLHVSSEHNAKEVYYTRDSVVYQSADQVTPGSVWPILFPGDNSFVCQDPTALSWSSISYHPTYWGV